MKKWLCLLLCMGCLCGCSAEVYETLGNVEHVSGTAPQMGKIVLALPEDAAVLTASGGDTMYICQDYSLAVQTLPGGDVQATIRSLSGFEKNQLTVMEQAYGDLSRYDFVWIAAGENGDAVCRASMIDDGNFHYCVTAIAEADVAWEVKEAWNALFATFTIETK